MSSPLRRSLAAVLALGCAAAAAPASASAADAAAAAPVRGTVLQVDRVATLSRAELAARVRAFRLPAARVHVGVDAFRLTYATVGVGGAPTTATGLVLLPRSHRRRLAVVSYAHGTLAARADAPSRGLDNLASASALLFGGAGYATAAPDYLGLGYGPGTHPYMHVATEGSASLDMLRAAHAFALRRHRVLDDGTLVTGFSQGAVAAMALGRLLQDGADARLRLRALAPMSGPFDIEHAEIPAVLAGRLDPSTSNYYLSYVLRSWQPIYHVYDAPGDVWTGPWGARVARLFDGRHDDVAILKALPQRLERLFTPAFRARLAHPDAGLLAAMRANDGACDWAPAVPTRIYAARGDEQVAFDNARSCAAGLRASGARVRLLDVGRRDHFGSTLAATPRVLRWFVRLGR